MLEERAMCSRPRTLRLAGSASIFDHHLESHRQFPQFRSRRLRRMYGNRRVQHEAALRVGSGDLEGNPRQRRRQQFPRGLLGGDLAQTGLEYLADRRHRHFFDDDDRSRPPGRLGDAGLDEVGQRGAVDRSAWGGRDEQDRRLASIGIGPPDRRGEADAGMAQRDVLDVGGIDIVAAADDHVLGAARDVDLAVLADAPEVAAAQPAFMESRADLLGSK